MDQGSVLPREIAELARRVVEENTEAGRKIALAESCTRGLVAAAITEVPGSSAVLDRGFVTYSNEAKTELVGVPAVLIEAHGAVSPEVASAMAAGGVARSRADIAVAVTGIAGPGGSDFKPEGLVCLHAMNRAGASIARRMEFGAIGRENVRRKSALTAFDMVLELVETM